MADSIRQIKLQKYFVESAKPNTLSRYNNNYFLIILYLRFIEKNLEKIYK